MINRRDGKMWKCQLCQRDFDDVDVKYEIPTTELQEAFWGVVELRTTEVISFLCEDCYREYLKVINVKIF